MNLNYQKIKKWFFLFSPILIYLLFFNKYFFGNTYLFGFSEWYNPYSLDHLKDYLFQSLFLYSDNNWGIPQYYPVINIFNGERVLISSIFGIILGQKIIVLSYFYFSFLACFLFTEKIIKNYKLSFILALIFSFNPFILNHFVFGHTVLIISMYHLLFSGYFLIKFYENKNKKNLILTIIFFSINPIHPLYISFYLFFYLLIGFYKEINIWKNIKYVVIISVVFFLLNSSWTFNLIFGPKSVDEVLNYKMSNLDRITNQSKPIINSFLNSEYFNKNRFLNDNKEAQLIFDISSILIWILTFGLIINKKIKNKKFYFILFISVLFLMNLSSGPFSPFGKDLFRTFYDAKIYQFYREVYHFTFLLIPLLFFLIAFLYSNCKLKDNANFKKIILIFTTIILFLRFIAVYEYNELPTFSQKIYGWNEENMTENTEDYKFICDKYKTSQYILFLPFYHTTYDLRTKSKDKEGGADLFLARNCVATIGNWVTLTPPFEKILRIFDESINNKPLFNNLGIEYVIFRKNFISGNEKLYNSNTAKNKIKNDQKFEFIEETDNFIIYRNNYNEGLLKSDNLSFKKINPTKYNIYIKNITTEQKLIFFEIFNSNWKIFIKKQSDWCNNFNFSDATNETECEYDQKYFEGEEISYLWKKPIFKNTHDIANKYANQWTIDPEYIKQNFSKEYYKENSDGSIDVEMVLYFKPQSYYYLGLAISGLTLLGITIYLAYDIFKRRKSMKKNGKTA